VLFYCVKMIIKLKSTIIINSRYTYKTMADNINLQNVTEFGRVEDIWNDCLHDKKGLCEFVNNVVMNMNMGDEANKNGYGIMLQDLSNIRVLVSTSEFPFNDLSAEQKRTSSIYFTGAERNYVLGYIWLCRWPIEKTESNLCHFINFIDSRISGLNIAKYMIEQYEMSISYDICLIPYEISRGAEKYWKKYLERVYNVKSRRDLTHFIQDCELTEGEIKWDILLKEL